MNPLVTLSGSAAPFLTDNVNTDMIAPMYRPAQAGVLRGLAVRREDLAGMLFAGLRYDAQDREISDFVLNRPPFRNAHFLLGGANFGCGSSRDTAALMLSAFGIRCVIAASFGEIFATIVSTPGCCRWCWRARSSPRSRPKHRTGAHFSSTLLPALYAARAGALLHWRCRRFAANNC
jgi:hypothetical protein